MVGAKEAARAAVIHYPKRGQRPSYSYFIRGIVGNQPNLKHFLLVDKAELDAEYEIRLRQHSDLDEAAIQKLLAKVSRPMRRVQRIPRASQSLTLIRHKAKRRKISFRSCNTDTLTFYRV